MQALTITIDVDGHGMALYVAIPKGDGPFPAIVVIQHAPGVDVFVHAMVHRLTEAGFVAAAPDLYHRLDPMMDGADKRKQLDDREIIADVNASVDFLQRHTAVQRAQLGIIGFCMGGRVAYLMAAVNPYFRAAVAYYGGNIMVPWGADVEAPFARTGEIRCPLMFHFGAEDTNPSPDDMRQLDDELSRRNKHHEFYTYAGAGHAFMNFLSPERYRKDAAAASWARTLEFFDRCLVDE
jgi:carboxymethylenebutenolidase